MEIKKQQIEDMHNQLDEILSGLEKESKRGTKAHKVELGLFRALLEMGLRLLKYYICLVQGVLDSEAGPNDSLSQKMRNKGASTRVYFSLFGKLKIIRAKYYSKTDRTNYPLDARLGLPEDSYSYVLKDWLSYGSVEMGFAQSAEQLERILGHGLHGMQSSRQTTAMSKEVDGYYAEKNWEGLEGGTHYSVGFDGKGVPIIRSERAGPKESPSARLSKGQKRGTKKEAVVSVSSSFTAKKRDAGEIIKSLFDVGGAEGATVPQKEKYSWHEEKHIRAFMSDKKKAIEYGIGNILAREATRKKNIVVLIDGDRALEKAVKKAVESKKIEMRIAAYILDFIHLLEYTWKVANAKLGEKHPQREEWVKGQAQYLLESETDKVLEEWGHVLEKKNMAPAQKKNVKSAITYLTNHKHMVDYKTYLKEGYPITTGAIESACGHFVKSRMERNAMHWSKTGAQKMLNIRAVKKNGDWDGYAEYFIEKEIKRSYPLAA
jgi:Uncharacterised protein family (UPF0236)